MHIPYPVPEQLVVVAELECQFLIFIGADVREEWSLEGLAMGVELGRLSGKRVVVDLSEAAFFSAEVLNELLRPACRGERLPRLAGPLSSPALQRLEVTGTLKLFEVFPTLSDAVFPVSDRDSRTRVKPSDAPGIDIRQRPAPCVTSRPPPMHARIGHH
ncbi:hypothetical protein [Streptomyces sp. NPDC055261]